jgi:hypothetical protein
MSHDHPHEPKQKQDRLWIDLIQGVSITRLSCESF